MKTALRSEGEQTLPKLKQIDWILCIYIVTINVSVISPQVNAILQNVTYILFLGCALIFLEVHIRLSAFARLYGLFLAFATMSLAWSFSASGTLTLLRILLKIYVICVLASSYYNTEEKSVRLMKAVYYGLLLTIVFLCVVTPVTQWTSASFGKAYGMDTVRYSVRTALCAVIGLYFYSLTKKKGFFVVSCVVMLLSLITAKRTGIVFFAIAIICYYLFVQKNMGKRLRAFMIAVLFAVIALQIINYIPILSETIGQRMQDFLNTFFGGQNVDRSTLQRTMLMEHAVSFFFRNPLIGNGLNTFRAYLGGLDYEHITYAHNNYLEIAGGLGLVGLVLYYSTYIYGIYGGAKLLKKNREKTTSFLLAVFIAYLVCDIIQVTYESYFEILILSVLITSIENKRMESK